MLVVENPIESEDALTNQKNFNVDEFIWPHGLTPPLHHVRKRRFRKRVNRRVHPLLQCAGYILTVVHRLSRQWSRRSSDCWRKMR